MAFSCSIHAHVKHNGKVVKSKLWSDLLSYSSGRSEAKQLYKVATDQRFINKVKNSSNYETDEYDQITYSSLVSILDLPEGENIIDKLRNKLNAGNIASKKNEDGSYNYDSYFQAMDKVRDFNRENPFPKYTAVAIRNKDGSYRINVVKNSASNKVSFTKTVRNQKLYDSISDLFHKHGINTSAIQNFNSILNKSKAISTLINIINKDEYDEDKENDTARLALDSMPENDDLVKRLYNSIDNIKYDKSKYPSKDAFAEHLIIEALNGRVVNDNTDISHALSLASRIVDKVKNMYNGIQVSDVSELINNASALAPKIVDGTVSADYDGPVNTLSIRDDIYKTESSKNVKRYRDVVANLEKMILDIKNNLNAAMEDSGIGLRMERVLKNTVSKREFLMGSVKDSATANVIALDGIVNAVYFISQELGPDKKIDRILKRMNFADISVFEKERIQYGTDLRQVHSFVIYSLEVLRALETTLHENNYSQEFSHLSVGTPYGQMTINLNELATTMASALNKLKEEVITKEMQYFARFLEDIYGEKYITMSARRLFKRVDGKITCVAVAETKMEVSKFIEESLSETSEGIGFYDRFLTSMSNNPDIFSSIVDKCIKQANNKSNRETEKFFARLQVLRAELYQICDEMGPEGRKFKDTSIFFEVGRNGKLTGNMVTDLNWGDWEDDLRSCIENEKKKFLIFIEKTPGLSSLEKQLKWHDWIKPVMKKFHSEHSVFVDGRYRPSSGESIGDTGRFKIDYTNHSDNLALINNNAKIRAWYQKWKEVKADIDKNLPEGVTLPVRMPQFKGRFVHKLRNTNMHERGIKAFGKTALRHFILETFCESSEDEEYGGMTTYNSEEDELFHNRIIMSQEKMRRIPLFGINKLTNMDDISTDLFYSTLSYAAMACTHRSLEAVVDSLEVGRDVISRRKYKDDPEAIVQRGQKRDTRVAYSYQRYCDYLEKNLYNIAMQKHSFLGKIVWEKIVAFTSKVATARFLGGNLAGGLVNAGTGTVEILKEALVGEDFTVADMLKADAQYAGLFVSEMGRQVLETGTDVENTRLALLVRYWNVKGDNTGYYKSWYSDRSRMLNVLDKALYWPYTSGDHYMQTVSYLCVANHIKLYTKDGKETSLIDAYDIVDNEDAKQHGFTEDPKHHLEYKASSRKSSGRSIILKNTYFKRKEDIPTYDIVQSIISKIESYKEASKSNPFGATMESFTDEEQSYLNKKGYEIKNMDNTLSMLRNDAEKMIWTEFDDFDFMMKARELSNRMHGIYNKVDAVAATKHWFFKALLCMKGWMLGMLQKRVMGDRYNVILKRNNEGMWDTFGKVLATMWQKEDIGRCLSVLILPFETSLFKERNKKFTEETGFSKHQFKNIRRIHIQAVVLAVLVTLSKLVFSKPPEDEKDEYYKALYGKNWKKYKKEYGEHDSKWMGLCYYMTNRLFREQAALGPFGVEFEAPNLYSVITPGTSAIMDIWTLLDEARGAALYDEDDDTHYFYKRSVEGKYEKGDSKFKHHLIRAVPYWKNYYIWANPYEAAKYYEVGRNTSYSRR